jgi:hypothetical protein
MNLYTISVPPMRKTLGSLERWLDAAAAYAEKKKFDPEVLLNARLAPDQYPLVRQIQAACDTAKFAAARLIGKEAPSHPDTEKTLDEVRARIRSVISWLDGVSEADFAGAMDRKPAAGWMGSKWMRADDYLVEFAVPNFYFHATTAYAILRHNGVDLGKVDFLGGLTLQG